MTSGISSKFTGLIVTYNEERRLRCCLKSLQFCDEVLVFDLGSTDYSVEIAVSQGAHVVFRDWVPVVEYLLPEAVGLAQYDWIVRLDPDEVLPSELAESLQTAIRENPDAAVLELPHQYYFLNRALRTSTWGGITYIPRVYNRKRVLLKREVHRGIVPTEGGRVIRVENPRYPVKHYWIEDFGQLFRKHRRYIREEGLAALKRGESFSWRSTLKASAVALRYSLVERRGWTGGWRGIFLSFFYAWYIGMSLLSLRRLIRDPSVIEGREKA